MNPADFLILAERLVMEGSRLANLRTATNRAYYATHHVGCQILRELRVSLPRGPQRHFEVPALLQHAGDEDIEEIGTKLDHLYGARRKADYDLEDRDAEVHKTVRAHVIQARRMIAGLQECLNEPKKSRVGATIREWETSRKRAIDSAAKPTAQP